MTILNPVVWSWERARDAVLTVGSARADEYWAESGARAARRIAPLTIDDLRAALRAGWADFAANRTDIAVLCLVYPVVGLVLGRLAFGYDVVPLIFPLASGFALLGPLAGVGLNEMSRRHERGEPVAWSDAFRVLRSPAIGAIALMGALLVALFLLWLVAAEGIYELTLGPYPPPSVGAFFAATFGTGAGWAMIVAGLAVGFVFAAVVLTISLVTFPMLLDCDCGLETAIGTSLAVTAANPRVVAAWGLVVAGSLALGSIPFLLGLPIALPVLGHATWHLYRRAVVPA